jgi:hypothetical protein
MVAAHTAEAGDRDTRPAYRQSNSIMSFPASHAKNHEREWFDVIASATRHCARSRVVNL